MPGLCNLTLPPSCRKPVYLSRMASGEVQGLNPAVTQEVYRWLVLTL